MGFSQTCISQSIGQHLYAASNVRISRCATCILRSWAVGLASRFLYQDFKQLLVQQTHRRVGRNPISLLSAVAADLTGIPAVVWHNRQTQFALLLRFAWLDQAQWQVLSDYKYTTSSYGGTLIRGEVSIGLCVKTRIDPSSRQLNQLEQWSSSYTALFWGNRSRRHICISRTKRARGRLKRYSLWVDRFQSEGRSLDDDSAKWWPRTMPVEYDFLEKQGPFPSTVGSGVLIRRSELYHFSGGPLVAVEQSQTLTILELLLAGSPHRCQYMASQSESPRQRKREDDDDDDDDSENDDAVIPSARQLWHEFLHSLTLHGFRFIFEEGPKIRRVFWCGLLFFAVAMLFFQSRKSIQKYFDHPITTSVEVEFVQEIMFPAVTICNFNLFPFYLINGTIGEKVSCIFMMYCNKGNDTKGKLWLTKLTIVWNNRWLETNLDSD